MRSPLMLIALAAGGCGGAGAPAKKGSLEAEVKETAASLGEAVGEVADKAGATAKEIAGDLKDAPDEASRNLKKHLKSSEPAAGPASESAPPASGAE